MPIKLFYVATLFALIGATFAATTVLADQENAYGFDYVGNNGVYSGIDTAYPAVRDNGYSYMRVGGQRFVNGNTLFLEIGWNIRYEDPGYPSPRSYWAWRPTNRVAYYGFDGYPGSGNYSYEITYLGGGEWRFFYNDMANPVATHYMGDIDYMDDYFSGGETSSASNEMGPSNNINVQYLRGGSWYPAIGWQTNNTNPSVYNVIPVINPQSWQVYSY